MLVNGNEEVLVVRAEPLGLAEEISHRMVEVERLEDGALLLDVDPAWAGAINAVLVNKGVRVSELRCAQAEHSSPANNLKPRCPHMRTRK
jgi:hypothetical protein